MSLPNFNDALKMLADPYCSLILRKVELHVILHSKYIGNKEQGITEFLEWKLGVYNTQFDGVLIAYDKVKTVDNKGMVLLDKPYIHYDITGDFIVFRPTIGAVVRGQINTPNTSDYLSCIIHKCFNACVTFEKNTRIPKLKKKDKILFTVDNIFNRNGVISLNGVVNRESFSDLGRKDNKTVDVDEDSASTKHGKIKLIKQEPEDVEDTTFSLKSYMNGADKEEVEAEVKVKVEEVEEEHACAKTTPKGKGKSATKKVTKGVSFTSMDCISSSDDDDDGDGGLEAFSTPEAGKRGTLELSVTPYPKHRCSDSGELSEDERVVVKRKKKKRKNKDKDDLDTSIDMSTIDAIKRETITHDIESTSSPDKLKKRKKSKDHNKCTDSPMVEDIKKEKTNKDNAAADLTDIVKKSKKSKKRKSESNDISFAIKKETSI